MMNDVAIRIERLSKQYSVGEQRKGYRMFRDRLVAAAKSTTRRLLTSPNGNGRKPGETFWALRDLSFDIKRGEVVGIIGRNGAGKSTLLKVLSRITEPTSGYADIHGRLSALLEVGTGFHSELTGRENIFLNAAILGMKKSEIGRKFDEIVAFSEVEKFIDTPVKHYSSGMYLRLAFAVAAHLEPDILLVDEVLAVGDTSFQKKCLGKMQDVANAGRTVLFVSHNMGAIRSLCTRGIVLHQGQIHQVGDVGQSVEAYYRLIGVMEPGVNGSKTTAVADGKNGGTGFGFISVNGGRSNTTSQSDELRLSTTLAVDHEPSGFYLFAILEDMQGRGLFHLKVESPELGLKLEPHRKLQINVSIPPLWLNPGLYSLHFKAMFWGGQGPSRIVSDSFPLDVQGESSRGASDGSYILNPAAKWSVHVA